MHMHTHHTPKPQVLLWKQAQDLVVCAIAHRPYHIGDHMSVIIIIFLIFINLSCGDANS